jgi:hypothetical protein
MRKYRVCIHVRKYTSWNFSDVESNTENNQLNDINPFVFYIILLYSIHKKYLIKLFKDFYMKLYNNNGNKKT